MRNTIMRADCLDFLADMPDETIDLIYIDPPFNTGKTWIGKDGLAFNDKWGVGDKGLHHYLLYMRERVELMRRVLKETGSFYYHCDPTISHYVKIMLDEIFGRQHYRNEIVWGYRTGGSSKRWFSRKHDIIFLYSKGTSYTFNLLKEKIQYHSSFFIENNKKEVEVSKRDVWDTGGNSQEEALKPLINLSKERIGYPTQKPIALLERIIKASSDEGDIVLDGFCGSGTTGAAAKKLGRWFYGCDLSAEAIAITKKRLALIPQKLL